MPGSTSSIKLSKLNSFLFIPLCFVIGASCQTVVTYSSKSSEELLCQITDDTVTATWSDESTGNSLSNYVRGHPDEIVDPGSKHNNFIYDVNGTSFSLFIQYVQAEDGGEYSCNTVGGGGTRNEYTVIVEVLAKPTVKNGSQDVDILDVIGGTSYDLTCSATGARSVSELSLMWDPSLVENTDLIVTTNGNFTDYSITSTYIAKKGDRTITCQLTGYVMQDEINDQLITHTVNLNVRYAPICSLVVQEGEDCTEVTLTCECDAVPADITQFSFFNGSSLINNGTINTFTESVAYRTSTEFSCSATNDIGPGDKSDVKVHECDKDTIETTEQQPITDPQSLASTTTKEQPTSNDDMSTGHGKKREPRSTNQIDEIKGAGNRAYMDLQELEVNKNKKNKNLEVPEKNVKLISLLPGKGMLRYHKALVMRAAGNLEAVVRTLSVDSTLRMNELQSSEVQHILKLPGDNSIMELLGWCDTVPSYLICEYLIGGTLSDHLTEEFSPQKVHQYGNTKQKHFQAVEKGNADHLPKYALQVARGLKFLTTHRFVSPGLRSKKVLLTASGKCKLYDFVSVENAKEWTELIWNENVPFQWMPPEFLLLETISAAGDVWSFGVLLWEIFSYGSEPYRGQTRADVEKSLRAKRQLLLPDNCPGAIWQVMITCWETVAEKRPKIDDVTFKLAAMCNEDKEYLEIE